LEKVGEKPTKRVIIDVGEESFNVNFEGEFTISEAYSVFLGCLKEVEAEMEKVVEEVLDNMPKGVLH
jgi:hypothetical protein